jgi:hypothetical protein
MAARVPQPVPRAPRVTAALPRIAVLHAMLRTGRQASGSCAQLPVDGTTAVRHLGGAPGHPWLPARALRPRRAIGCEPGGAGEPRDRRARVRRCRRRESRRCTAGSTLARGGRRWCGPHHGQGGRLEGMGAGVDTLRPLGLGFADVFWTAGPLASEEPGRLGAWFYQDGTSPGLPWASPEGAHVGGIFPGRAPAEPWLANPKEAGGPALRWRCCKATETAWPCARAARSG